MEAIEKIMRPLNTFGVQFLIRQDKLKEGKAPVYVRITVNGQINREEVINLVNNLEQVRLALDNYYHQMQVKGEYITAATIKDAYLGIAAEEPGRLSAYHNEQARPTLAWSTLKHYYVTKGI